MKYKSRKLIARNIVYYRLKLKWSQETFAEKLGTTTVYLSEVENAKRNIGIDFIDRISFALEINPEDLFIPREESVRKRVSQK